MPKLSVNGENVKYLASLTCEKIPTVTKMLHHVICEHRLMSAQLDKSVNKGICTIRV